MELPVDAHLATIASALRARGALVIVAEPGAGKTTRVPPALLREGLAGGGEIVVLEPRRLAARMAARRVAAELGETVGRTIGYTVRFEDVGGKETRIRFVTEGVLTRRLADDPELRGISVLVLDELHERHLHSDLALAFARRLRATSRPDLRVVAMSATMEAEPVARFLECDVARVPGRTFPVAIEHADAPDDRPLEHRVAVAVRKLVARGLDGDVLVFLPGAAEIRRARAALEPDAERFGIELTVLHGDLSAAEQDRAVARGDRRKVILSTNVAESSVTIEGVAAVVDSGLARVARHSPWSGLPTLETAPISRASAAQRAGRAGRTRAGLAVRLYTEHDHDTRPEHDAPEIVVPTSQRWRCSSRRSERTRARFRSSNRPSLRRSTPPTSCSLASAPSMRTAAPPPSASERAGSRSTRGSRRCSFTPRRPASRRRDASSPRSCPSARSGSKRERAFTARRPSPARSAHRTSSPAATRSRRQSAKVSPRARFDHTASTRALRSPPNGCATSSYARSERVATRGAALRVLTPLTLRGRTRTASRTQRLSTSRPKSARCCWRRSPPFPIASVAVVISGRTSSCSRAADSAKLAPTSVVRDSLLLVACEVEDRRRGGALIRAASAIEAEDLLELFPDRVRDSESLVFRAAGERVERVRTLAYEGLVLDESQRAADGGPEATRVLVDAVLARGLDAVCDVASIEALKRRLAFTAENRPDIEPLDDGRLGALLVTAAEGATTFDDLRAAHLPDLVRESLPASTKRALEELAPERVRLPGRPKGVEVHYERDRPPWIESRLQDFFGLVDGPRVGGGRVPLVLHLLAPNKRAVQVTTDLAGFWKRHYPELRRALSRRYPKHAWPEDPTR